MQKNNMFKFTCGCSFPIVEQRPNTLPLLEMNPDTFPDCKAVWTLLGNGDTKGIFQLETQFASDWCKKLKPENIEQLGALTAIIRPGSAKCISGDTMISIRRHGLNYRTERDAQKISISSLYEKFNRNHINYKNEILSCDESNRILFSNKILNIFKNGLQNVYRPKFKLRKRENSISSFYNLECTLEHKFLSHDRGWLPLKDIKIGERIAVINHYKEREHKQDSNYIDGEKYFQEICFKNYKYKCIFCDWKEASLDVNHIDGNRKSNNDQNNLCFMCPNHHKMYSEKKILKHQLVENKEKNRLILTKDIAWAEYAGYDFIGEKETYDIEVEGPNHNYIAGNVLVHNCIDENGQSTTEKYCLRKNNQQESKCKYKILEPILYKTYNLLLYQEQILKIAELLGGFNLVEQDAFRKSVGKKDQEALEKICRLLIEKAVAKGLVTKEVIEDIVVDIKKSGRYLFNKSHAISYAIKAYKTAYIKAHTIDSFFASWLLNAHGDSDPRQEILELVEDSKKFDIQIQTPDISTLESKISTDGITIKLGLSDVKGVGEKQVEKLIDAFRTIKKPPINFSWSEFLFNIAEFPNSTAIKGWISTGAFRWTKLSRTRMLKEYDIWCELTDKEKSWIKENNHGLSLIQVLKMLGKTKKDGGGCHTAKRADIVNSMALILENGASSDDDQPNQIVDMEENYLGVAISCNRIDACDVSMVNCSCSEFLAGRSGKIYLGVEVKNVKTIKTKKGDEMAFVDVADATCAIQGVVVFPNKWSEYKDLLRNKNTLVLTGYSDKKKGSFVLDKAYQI